MSGDLFSGPSGNDQKNSHQNDGHAHESTAQTGTGYEDLAESLGRHVDQREATRSERLEERKGLALILCTQLRLAERNDDLVINHMRNLRLLGGDRRIVVAQPSNTPEAGIIVPQGFEPLVLTSHGFGIVLSPAAFTWAELAATTAEKKFNSFLNRLRQREDKESYKNTIVRPITPTDLIYYPVSIEDVLEALSVEAGRVLDADSDRLPTSAETPPGRWQPFPHIPPT